MRDVNLVEQGQEERHPRSSLLVLGMHRSGTSAITGALGLCGAWVGEEGELTGANVENPRGFWERRDTREICDRLLHASGADWWKVANFDLEAVPRAVLAEERKKFAGVVTTLSERGTWVLKEPRLCLLLPALRDYVADPVCIHIFRNPLEVARSLQMRNGFGIAGGLALWEAYNLHALNAAKNLPRILVFHESLMLRPMETVTGILGELAELGVGGLAAPNEARLEHFVNPSLYRKRVAKKEANDFLSASQRTLWRRLCSGEIRDEMGSLSLPRTTRQHLFDLESTERSLKQFTERTKALNREVSARRRTIGELERRTARLTTELGSKRSAISAHQRTIKAQAETIGAREATIEAQTETIGTHEATIESQAETIGAHEATIESQAETIGAHESTIESQAETIGAHESTIESQAETIGAHESTIESQAETIGTREATIESQAETIGAREKTIESRGAAIGARDATIQRPVGINELESHRSDAGPGPGSEMVPEKSPAGVQVVVLADYGAVLASVRCHRVRPSEIATEPRPGRRNPPTPASGYGARSHSRAPEEALRERLLPGRLRTARSTNQGQRHRVGRGAQPPGPGLPVGGCPAERVRSRADRRQLSEIRHGGLEAAARRPPRHPEDVSRRQLSRAPREDGGRGGAD